MSIDKAWIRRGLRRADPEFKAGLNAFFERCKEHVNDRGFCYCPCRKCRNSNMLTPSEIKYHIHDNGFNWNYTHWVHHGEPVIIPPPVVDDTNDMINVLNVIRRENNYIDNTSTSNEPDIASTSNEPPEELGPTKDDLEGLFEMANEELFPGCSWMSSLDFLAKFTHLKALHKWTDVSFNQTMDFLRKCFPSGNKVPKSHYEAKKSMKKVGLGYESIHACINDCALFWKDNEDLENCPICNASRWKNKDTTGKKVSNKVLRYFPLKPRLKRMYGSLETAKHMTWHATGKCTEDGKMGHPVDGKAWKEFDKNNKEFAKEKRNVRLGLAADGFNPFGNLSQSYSMWPVILTTYNTPPWICMKESSFMLTLLIPGPKSAGKDIDVYLRPLVEELKDLWKGVKMLDAATNTEFTMKAMLLWTINDFPARSSLSGWSGQGYMACPTCNDETPSTRVLGKTAFVGHRRFLPEHHRWRRDKRFNGKNDDKAPPKPLTSARILEQLDELPSRIPGKHPSHGGVKRTRDPDTERNWSKRSIFFELPYWSSLALKHNLDVMHIEKNVLESLLNTLLMNDKSKDTIKARQDLQAWKIRKELWLTKQSNGKFIKPHPKYSFPPEKRRKFCEFIRGVKLPDGFGSNFKQKVTDNDNNITGMKSHDCHIMMQRLLPVGAHAFLDSSIATPIIELCSFFKQICARSLMESDMLKAQEQLIRILCNFEQIYPPAFFDIMIHLVMHLPEEAIQGGPVYMRWMYPFERYMKKLKNYARNKAKPEGSIAEGYVADEAITFCSHYLRNVQTRFNRPERNDDGPPPTCKMQVFRSVCSPKSAGVVKKLDYELKMKLVWYILDNCHEIDKYKTECRLTMSANDLPTKFPRWFCDKISILRAEKPAECSLELLSLANGPKDYVTYYTSCIVNGVKFVVHSRDQRLTTQNSGVSTPGENGTKFYGVVEEILELTYLTLEKVVLFRCKWFKTNNTNRTELCATTNNITSISTRDDWWRHQQYILATQVTQVFYLADPSRSHHWKVVQDVNHRKIWDKDIIVDVDVIHDNISSNLALTANLEDLEFTRLSGVGPSTEVDVPTSLVDDEDFIDDNVEYDAAHPLSSDSEDSIYDSD